ncbi:hypothetical protein GCM10010341_48600 [Streptomyces noursei]|nr:hypothetical protein GCM10010341_48600 [Streptomyces noursei]
MVSSAEAAPDAWAPWGTAGPLSAAPDCAGAHVECLSLSCAMQHIGHTVGTRGSDVDVASAAMTPEGIALLWV